MYSYVIYTYRTTWQYDDSCQNVYLFCDPKTNTCNYKGCTNSDYMKGWDTRVHPYPQRCGSGTFCPDDNSQCKALVNPGGACELQRDDECAGQVPICLNATCYVKAAPLSGRCATDITEYVSYDARGYALRQRIVRDNCIQDTYCDESNGNVCIPSKANGAACDQDRECLSQTCGSSGICMNGPDVFHTIAPWLWAVLAIAVCLFILLILGILWVLHRYQSKKERAKIAKFFGDNEEFAKYAMLEEDDAPTPRDQRTSMVFLTHPELNTSMALGTTRPLSFFRSNNSSSSRLRTPPLRPSPGSITPPFGGSRSSMPRGSASDLNAHTPPFEPDHRRSNLL
ncbi:hypothetical protein BJV82DRAFT_634200 [Fennellomyces sp. T-0311]|nr:hypothetical protein BJV82DRAFT_634200 [Fennellomyces sp. T-0311]